jgi:hypothetical protein
MASSAGEPPPSHQPEEDVVSVGKSAAVSLEELTRAHALVMRSRKDPANLAEATRSYEVLLAAFERTHGPIVGVFWGEDETSAAVLTSGRRRALAGLLGKETPPRLHVVSGGFSKAPHATELEHRCGELAIRASVLLVGAHRRIALEWLLAVAGHVFGFAERGSAKAKHERAEAASRQLDAELRRIEEYVGKASARIARLRYFWGTLLGLLIVGIGAVVAEVTAGSAASVDRVIASVAAGALGAVISVMQRMSTGRIGLVTDVDRATIVRLGTLRPLIGAVSGALVYLLFAAKLVVVLPADSTSSTSVYTYAVTAFFAGFAERWMKVLVEPVTSLRAEEVAERIPAAVEESVRATLLGPVLARWHGFVSVSIAGQETVDGASRLRPLEQAELTIRFGQEETGSASERRIDIREGEDAPEVSFGLRLDSDTVSLPHPEQTLAVRKQGTVTTEMPFTAPKATGSHRLWLRVSQRNRVVQIVPFELEVED